MPSSGQPQFDPIQCGLTRDPERLARLVELLQQRLGLRRADGVRD